MNSPRIAIIGAGWAGLAAAIEAICLGARVSVYERAPAPGGRARRVAWQLPDGTRLEVDNGQHILIGAYRDTLALMRRAGVDERAALDRRPLRVVHADGTRLVAPRWPAPLHLAAALLGARGLSWRARASSVRFVARLRLAGWRLARDIPVTELLARHRVDAQAVRRLWEPLCVAALNTPAACASAQVFLNVLRDSVGADRAASDLLLPRGDLSAVLPDAAWRRLEHCGATLAARCGVQALEPVAGDGAGQEAMGGAGGSAAGSATGSTAESAAGSAAGSAPGWIVRSTRGAERFDAVVLATAPRDAAALLAPLSEGHEALARTAALAAALEPSAIATAWMVVPDGPHWAPAVTEPMTALADDARSPGQWLFVRQALPGGRRLLAVVVSTHARDTDRDALAAAIRTQIGAAFARMAGLPAGRVVPPDAPARIVVEKQATFLCTPGLRRPGHACGRPGLWLAGDYTDGPYPGTLESAVRSGLEAARLAVRALGGQPAAEEGPLAAHACTNARAFDPTASAASPGR